MIIGNPRYWLGECSSVDECQNSGNYADNDGCRRREEWECHFDGWKLTNMHIGCSGMLDQYTSKLIIMMQFRLFQLNNSWFITELFWLQSLFAWSSTKDGETPGRR
jgi:hypothetical protein